MKLHEYQAKEFFSRYGIPIPTGEVASTADEAKKASATLDGSTVIKAQVHAGGRGKGGGIRVVATPEEAYAAAESLIVSQLITPQTGPIGVASPRTADNAIPTIIIPSPPTRIFLSTSIYSDWLSA